MISSLEVATWFPFSDISDAFDTVDHSLLLEISVFLFLVSFLPTYLIVHSINISTRGNSSSFLPLSVAVRQETFFGTPLFFSLSLLPLGSLTFDSFQMPKTPYSSSLF